MINSEPTNSHRPVIAVKNVTKIFRLYNRQLDRIREALSFFGRKAYHHPFYALKNITFTIHRGDTVGIVGRNGSGKSTLLQIICGILQPTAGSAQVWGRISALLELGAGFNPEFTGRENVYLNGEILGISRQEMDDCFEDIESFAAIGEFIDQPVKSYSSGMYVRLAFAVAINVNPDILIVDEALSVGDTAFQAKCFAKFREFQNNGVTILFVTHSMDLISRYCNNAILLEQGQMIKLGPAKDIVDEYNRLIVDCSEAQMVRTEESDASAADMDTTDYDVPEKKSSKRILTHLRATELAYQLNPSENRYGNGKAEIIEVGIDSLSEKEKYSFVHGEKYRFWFKTLFHETIKDPITAYTIKDVKGFDITGTNTLFQKKDLGVVNAGEIILTEFDQRMMLNPGGYLLSFGCAGFDEGGYVVYDRRYDMITFDVVSDRSSVGLFDLGSEIKISRVKK
ncbi:ABC transporter ATP-binding protein [Desulforhopalus sp. IMCC35007]|nr:ABC transporter ATP-binding protein [Desulforhopalus sp. IMCC35007]